MGCWREAFKPPQTDDINLETARMERDKTNHLVNELSPYLQQHAYNPVDWYPWSNEAFTKAKQENKPIFLSIGYSTCHWCHVMEHESFEDEAVAAFLNKHFVSIKVDREERPDIDAIYMTVTQLMTGSGGWPMSIFMTPDKEPFFAGTYIPKVGKWGRMGLVELLPRIIEGWKSDRDKIAASTDQIKQALEQTNNYRNGEGLGQLDIDSAIIHLKSQYDEKFGGFSQSPKFPSPHTLLLILRQYKKTGDQSLLEMVEGTLTNMRLGGIWDHVGFGFHRYSTDRQWLLPHFEKMLYDQALLLQAYTEAYQLTDKGIYAQTAREIMTYVMRDMQAPSGGYYSAEDADSDGEEGKFYIWTTDELRQHLGSEAESFIAHYNALDNGNFHNEATGKQHPANILHLKTMTTDNNFESARKILFDIREKRIHPLRDRKILSDWNGLMIGAAAYAGKVLNEPTFIASAEKAANYIHQTMRNEDGRLYKRSFDGKAGLDGLLDDYAFMVWGLTELYDATWDANYLYRAIDLNQLMIKHFSDGTNGFYHTPDDGEELLIRQQEIYDGAIPAGNSVAALNLLRLGHITGETELLDRAESLFKSYSNRVKKSPSAHTFLLMSVDFSTAPVSEVVIVGNENDSIISEMRAQLAKDYLPNKVVIHVDSNNQNLIKRFSHLGSIVTSAKSPVAYVCQGFSCQQPTSEPEKLKESLKNE